MAVSWVVEISIVQSNQVNCGMRLITIFIFYLSLRSGSNGFSVDYVVNKLKAVQGLFGSLSQSRGR